jgi:AraC-like DNA-binding protein
MIKANILSEPIPSLNLKQVRPDGNGDFEIYRVNKALVPGNTLFLQPHRRNFYQFAFVFEGNSRFWADLQYYSFEPGKIYFTGPSQVLVKEIQLPLDGIILCFTKEFLQMAALIDRLPVLNSNKAIVFKPSAKERKEMKATLHQLLDEVAKKDELSLLSLVSGLGTFLVQISRLYNQFPEEIDTPQKGKITEFLRLVNSGFSKHHLVAEYAELLNITAGHLNDLVKKHTGKTALLCIQERIMLEAKYMLFHKTDPIKAIAFALGFSEASYFSQFFKRQMGISPEDYRSNILEISSRTLEINKP